MSPRLRRVLRLVDELELDRDELQQLGQQLAERGAFTVEWDKVHPGDKELVDLLQRRMATPADMVSMAEGDRIVRQELRRRRGRVSRQEERTPGPARRAAR
jgi:hypothetical protein